MILSNTRAFSNLKDEAALRQSKIATQLSNGAIDHINNANPDNTKEAVNHINAMIKGNERDFPEGAGSLMDYLERKTKIDLVMNTYAKNWDEVSKKDFADAFRMPSDKIDVMDAIVSIAMLNEKTLPEQLIAENTPKTTVQDLLENHRIIYQYPPPGTPLQQPYIILVAVEYQELAKAEEIARSTLGQLEDYQGIKIPAATKLKLVPNSQSAIRTIQPYVVTRSAKLSDAARSEMVSDVARSAKISDVTGSEIISDVAGSAKLLDVISSGSSSDVIRKAQIMDAMSALESPVAKKTQGSMEKRIA